MYSAWESARPGRSGYEAKVQARDPKAYRPPSSEASLPNRSAGIRAPLTRPAPFSPASHAADPRPAEPRAAAPLPPVPGRGLRQFPRPVPFPPRGDARPGMVPGPARHAITRAGFGLPNLRRNVCPHFYMTGARGAIPIQAPHLLKALIRQEQNVSRCQLRGGVHLEQGYVNDVCLTPRFNQCVFYEDELTKD